MKKIITFLLVIFSAANTFGQTDLPPAFEITADTVTSYIYLPDSNWQMMADPTGKMTIEQVLQSKNFQDTNRNIDYHINTYWIRYRLNNKMAKDVQLILWLRRIQYADLYTRTDSLGWQHYRTGELVPWSQRDGLKSLIAMNLTIPAGKTLLIFEHHTFDYKISRPDIEYAGFSFSQRVAQLQRSHYTNSLVLVFVLGLLVLAVAINLYFFFIVREKEFLYFTLFILGFGITWGSGLDDIFFKDHPAVSWYISSIVTPFVGFFLIYSVRHFLKTFIRFPRWDTFLVILSFIQVIGFWFSQFGPSALHKNLSTLSNFLNVGFLLLICLSLLLTIFLYRRDKDKVVRLVIYALAPYAISLSINCIQFAFNNINYFKTINEAIKKFMLTLEQINGIVYVISLVWLIVLFACILFMRFSMLRRKYAREKLEREQERSASIERQKMELEKQVTERTSELQQSLENLKSTQKQLIQSEKMASLGELTAGIAHEIQNPLNFVNNFSDVNKEMLEELKTERLKPKAEQDEQLKDDLINDAIVNSEKINLHGKRAADIVKGMLQHSRTSTGQKEPTDINALCDEYLRLSYHGLRAKDKSFNAEMKTDFDQSIDKINIIPQDIGRVLLNLYNNAFYAVAEKKKLSAQGLPTFERLATLYEPIVSVNTKKIKNSVLITVSDNGNGIPQKIVDKIFQPFFTTKPTGSGTGLGLSLSYDIVKAHGGEIKVESKEGEGSEFVIQLPIT